MTPTTLTFQLGDPVEHRGIVDHPALPRPRPGRRATSRSTRRCRAASRSPRPRTPARCPSSRSSTRSTRPCCSTTARSSSARSRTGSSTSRVLVGAGAKLPIPVSCVEQGRWNRSSVDFDSASHISHAHLRRRKAEMLAAQPLARGRRAERGVAGDRREAAAHVGRLAHRRQPRHLRGLRRPPAQARGRVPAPAGPVRRRARDRRRPLPRHRLPPRRVRAPVAEAAGRLPARRARAARPAARRHRADRRLRRRGRRRRRHPRPLRRARRGRAPARPRRDRLRPRARRRADPAQRLHERRTAADRAFGRIARPSRRR